MTPEEQKALLEEYHNLRGKSTFDASLTGEWRKVEARLLAMMSVPRGRWITVSITQSQFVVDAVVFANVEHPINGRLRTYDTDIMGVRSFDSLDDCYDAVETAFAKWWRSAQGVGG